MLQVNLREPLAEDDLQHLSPKMLQVDVNVLQVTADLQQAPDSGRPAALNVLQINGPERSALRILLQIVAELLQLTGLLLQIRADLQHLFPEMLRIYERRALRSQFR